MQREDEISTLLSRERDHNLSSRIFALVSPNTLSKLVASVLSSELMKSEKRSSSSSPSLSPEEDAADLAAAACFALAALPIIIISPSPSMTRHGRTVINVYSFASTRWIGTRVIATFFDLYSR